MPKLLLTDLSIRALKADERTDFWDTRLPSFGVRVNQRTKSFIAKLGNRRITIGPYPALSLQEARRRALTLKAEVPSEVAAPAPQTTFLEAYEAFKTVHASQKKERTQADYARVLDKHYLPKLRSKKLREIEHGDIARITDKLMGTPSERSHTIAVGRTFFKFCVRRRLIDASPLDGVQLPKSTPRDRVLSDHELKCIWQACEPIREGLVCGDAQRSADAIALANHQDKFARTVPPDQPINPTFAAIVKLLILTGQRKGEITNLQTSWIYDDRITLPRAATKNGREHTFPIGQTASQILRSWSGSAGCCIFAARGSDGGSPFNGFSKCKVALDQKLGPDFQPWTLHDLRRTFATNLAALGVRMEVTEKLLNHVSGSFGGIVSVYQKHSFMPEMREAVEHWEKRLAAIVL